MTAGHLFTGEHFSDDSKIFVVVSAEHGHATLYEMVGDGEGSYLHQIYFTFPQIRALATDILQICEEAQQEFDTANLETQAGEEWDTLMAAADEYWQIMAEEDYQRLIEATIEANLEMEADYLQERRYMDA